MVVFICIFSKIEKKIEMLFPNLWKAY